MRRRISVVIVAVLVLGFAFGIARIFSLRFESGAVYPPYSTFRPDPLGARALYESIALQPGVTAWQNALPLRQLHGRDSTVFLLGMDGGFGVYQIEETLAPDLERLANEGARLVIAFLPAWRTDIRLGPPRDEAPPDKTEKKNAKPRPLFERLGVTVERKHSTSADEVEDMKRRLQSGAELPRHTALWFDHLASDWKVQETWHDHPVRIERAWKRGSVVLIADSWMLSNDALSREPDAAALARLVGPNHTVVFDESHLGVFESGSVAGLMRRYHL